MKSAKQTLPQWLLGLSTFALLAVFTGASAHADVKFGSVAKDKRQHTSSQRHNNRHSNRGHNDRRSRNGHSSRGNRHASNGRHNGHYKKKHSSRHYKPRYHKRGHYRSNFYVSYNGYNNCRYIYDYYGDRVRRCYPPRYNSHYDRGHHYGYRYHDRYGNYYTSYHNGRYTRSNHRGHHRHGHYYDNKVGQWIALAIVFDALLDHHH